MASRKSQAKKDSKYAKKRPGLVITLFLLVVVAVAATTFALAFSGCGEMGEHFWSEWEITAEADCGNAGKRERTCLVCGEKQTEDIPATGIHSWDEWQEVTPVKCLEDGKEERACTVCGESEQKTISAPGEHKWGEWQEVAPVKCLEDGKEERACTVCGESEQKTVPAPGEHKWDEWQVVTEATCGKDGTKERNCTICKETDGSAIPATGLHNWGEWQVVTEAICGNDGTKEQTCSVCGEKQTEAIPAPGEHEWGEWEITAEADCGNAGEREHICSLCGEKQTEEIPATGLHSWGEWQEVTPVRCLEDGTEERTCTVCENSEQKTIPAPGEHKWGEWEITAEADCGNAGEREQTCPVCGEKQTEEIHATDLHNYNDSGVCTVCGNTDPSFGNNVIPGSAEEVATAQLSIHFLELGNKYTGDSTLIKCGDTEVLIDAGSRKDSATAIKTYVDKYCTDGVLEYVITTHAHQDHIAGFVGSSKSGILYQYKVGTLIQFARTNATSQIYKDYLSAVEYAKGRGTQVYTAKQCWDETDGAKKQYYLDDEGKVSLNILYNYYYDNKSSNENNYSVCTLLTNECPGRTYNYLFTGDLEESGESYLVDRNELPEVDLFKGGHHGSYTASTDKLLKVIKPKNVAVCCCCGTTEYTSNTNNTFPAQAFIDRVSKYTENIYCTTLILDYSAGEYTSMNGNIVFYYDNRLKLYCSNNDTILKETDWFKANRTWNGQ